ncbi:MAG: hypothetical protein JW850_17770, partial [Thermoflexales bacterium]|nr:hypothetical protein [Thermoflexales bacterium]
MPTHSPAMLPDDIRLQPGAQAVLDLIAGVKFASPAAYRLRLQAERLALMAGFDVLAGLGTLDFEPFDVSFQKSGGMEDFRSLLRLRKSGPKLGGP